MPAGQKLRASARGSSLIEISIIKMDINEKQMASEEQKSVLNQLAEAVAKPACIFLEVGSWCGDSTVVLAKIAKQHGGLLYCVDWWKGNIGTKLNDIAAVEDVFQFFWKRICSEGLDDVVIPIRSKSELAALVLKDNLFDFIFIDADHRYNNVLNDVRNFSKMVRMDGGILCGHDCEGFISDYDMDFLEKNKDVDCHESVHCGVVLAIGTYFNNYSINDSIWSVRYSALNRAWEPTNVKFSGVKKKRQVQPPPLGSMLSHNLFRYGKLVYAVPHSLGYFDITDEDGQTLLKDCKSANTIEGIETLMGENLFHAKETPVLLECYKLYNIVKFKNIFYGMSLSLGPIDMEMLSEVSIKEFQDASQCVIANSFYDVKQLIDNVVGNYKKNNTMGKNLGNA